MLLSEPQTSTSCASLEPLEPAGRGRELITLEDDSSVSEVSDVETVERSWETIERKRMCLFRIVLEHYNCLQI